MYSLCAEDDVGEKIDSIIFRTANSTPMNRINNLTVSPGHISQHPMLEYIGMLPSSVVVDEMVSPQHKTE